MISPSREDLAPFEGFKAADFAAWLKAGLEAYLIEDEGIWGFEHVAVFLQGEEHLALALGHVYGELPARNRAEFRKAVADVMATLEADPVNAPVFEHLLAIAAVLPAPEVLDVLPVKIGNGFFGTINAEGGRGLFEKTMDAVIDLAAPTVASRDCLEMLIGSRNFNVAYSGLALLTLCRVAPRDFAAHMNLLRAPLARMFEEFQTDEETKKQLAQSVKVAVTGKVVAECLFELALLESVKPNDQWFFRHAGLEEMQSGILVVLSPGAATAAFPIKKTTLRRAPRPRAAVAASYRRLPGNLEAVATQGANLFRGGFLSGVNAELEGAAV
ncbi:MAG: hypothetical protein H6907_21820 [Hyphomicrobiales bacterium]|nr:hypothetical protein [Hyphomicrobiales bacterium]MCP5374383.1 hypothetical protein [Hyphomicrobiales bacterium]